MDEIGILDDPHFRSIANLDETNSVQKVLSQMK